MLKNILIVTTIVHQLSAVGPAYRDHLHYQSVADGTISQEVAATWGAPAMTGKRYLLMQPASGADVYLRFVEDPQAGDAPAPLTTHGWGATELLVSDPDELARRLEQSPFKVIGPPKDLYAAPNAPRAMQVRGPADEILYLTRAIPGGSRYDLGVASSFVDRPFIVVVGGPSMTELRRFYGEVLGLAPSAPTPFMIGVLSEANALPPQRTFPLAMVPLSSGHLIELDEYPAVTRPRSRVPGHLPPRMAMVGFLADSLDATAASWRSRPRPLDIRPYDGRRVGVMIGPAGEWLEVVERTPP